MSSVGAAFAAQSRRGNRNAEDAQDYSVVLPPLPTGSVVFNTIFLHGDVRARPYRVEDFRDALAQDAVLADIAALGTYQMNHIWAVTFTSEEGKKKVLAKKEITVKGHRCLVIDPCQQDVRVKLHWVLHNVPDDQIKEAFAPYGTVVEVTKEKWRATGCANFSTMTRIVVLRLKGGVARDDLPHQLRIGTELALVAVPGRPPLCLRCQQTGHIRRECRVPKCNVCRRFGHDGANCVKTYAAATGPGATEERWKHIMDEAEAEEVVKGPDEEHTPIPADTDTPAEEGDIDEGSAIEGTTGTEETAAAQAPEVQPQDTPLPSIDDGYPSDASMDAEDAATRGKDGAFNELAAKRPREDSAADADAKNLVGSASTGPTARKKRPEPKTNIQVGERRPPKPPS
ncbi:uncharacterized protein LOC144170641 [Haemaphysalis longicornis]